MNPLASIAIRELSLRLSRAGFWATFALVQSAMSLYLLVLVMRYIDNEEALYTSGTTSQIITPYMQGGVIVLLLMLPLITMGAIAEDRRSGRLRFYFSLPLAPWMLVVGRFVALGLAVICIWLLPALQPLTLLRGSALDVGVYNTNLIGMGLFMMMHLALGVCCSSAARNPLIAAALSASISLGLWFLAGIAHLQGGAAAVGGLSTAVRLRSFAHGMLHPGDIAYFVLGTLALMIAACWFVQHERARS